MFTSQTHCVHEFFFFESLKHLYYYFPKPQFNALALTQFPTKD